MNFDLSEDQRLLVGTVASFVKNKSPVSRARALREDPLGWSPPLWRQMGEFGWLGVAFPESVGGAGGSFVDAALVLEHLATTLVPEPVLPALVAGTAILRAGNDEQRARFLLPLVNGQEVLTLACAEAHGRHDPLWVETRAERRGGAWRLQGAKRFVLAGHAADAIVVPARTAGQPGERAGIGLFVLDRQTPGLEIQPVKTMDGRRAALLRLDCEVGDDRRLGPEGGGAAVLEQVMDLGATACCAEGAGIARTVLAMTTDYLKIREQFGVKIGTFQALQHRAVDMFVETELCKSTAIMAAIKMGEPDEVERKSAISAAKVQLAVGGRQVTQQAIQLHGGIGITDEHDVGLYFKRMHILNTLFGDEEHHLARYASLPSFVAGLEA